MGNSPLRTQLTSVPFQFVNHNIPTSIGRTAPPNTIGTADWAARQSYSARCAPSVTNARTKAYEAADTPLQTQVGTDSPMAISHSSVEMGNALKISLINADPISIYHILEISDSPSTRSVRPD